MTSLALGEVHLFTGEMLASQGNLHEAILHHQQALELATRIGDDKLKTWTLVDIVSGTLSLGDFQKAEELAARAHETAKRVGHKGFIAGSHARMCTVSLCQGHWEAARDAWQRAAQVCEETGNPGWRIYAAHGLGRAYLAEGKREEAARQFQQSLALAKPVRPWLTVVLAQNLSGLEEALDDPEAFRAFCLRFREEDPEFGATPFVQWFLEPAEPRAFSQQLFDDRFADTLSSDWIWQDPFGDCSFAV